METHVWMSSALTKRPVQGTYLALMYVATPDAFAPPARGLLIGS